MERLCFDKVLYPLNCYVTTKCSAMNQWKLHDSRHEFAYQRQLTKPGCLREIATYYWRPAVCYSENKARNVCCHKYNWFIFTSTQLNTPLGSQARFWLPGEDDKYVYQTDSWPWLSTVAIPKGRFWKRRWAEYEILFGKYGTLRHRVRIYGTALQRTVSLQCTDVELVALSASFKTVIWPCQILTKLNEHQEKPKIHQDANDIIRLANGGSEKHYSRQKHIGIPNQYVM